MPRARPNHALEQQSYKHFTLPKIIEHELLDFLNLDSSVGRFEIATDPESLNQRAVPTKAGSALGKVEQVLGMYRTVGDIFDKQPRPSDYLAAFSPVAKLAARLTKEINALSLPYRNQLAGFGADLASIEYALKNLQESSREASLSNAHKSSQGAPKNTALKFVVRSLRLVFRDHYQGPHFSRVRKGAFEILSPQEEAELNFVLTSLKAGNIVPKAYTSSKMRRLFLHPDCSVPGERAATIGRIAKKISTLRGRNKLESRIRTD